MQIFFAFYRISTIQDQFDEELQMFSNFLKRAATGSSGKHKTQWKNLAVTFCGQYHFCRRNVYVLCIPVYAGTRWGWMTSGQYTLLTCACNQKMATGREQVQGKVISWTSYILLSLKAFSQLIIVIEQSKCRLGRKRAPFLSRSPDLGEFVTSLLS